MTSLIHTRTMATLAFDGGGTYRPVRYGRMTRNDRRLLQVVAVSALLHALVLRYAQLPRVPIVAEPAAAPLQVALRTVEERIASTARASGTVAPLEPPEELAVPPAPTLPLLTLPADPRVLSAPTEDLRAAARAAAADWAADQAAPDGFHPLYAAEVLHSAADPLRHEVQIQAWREPDGMNMVAYRGRCYRVWDADPVATLPMVVWIPSNCPEDTPDRKPFHPFLPLWAQLLDDLISD